MPRLFFLLLLAGMGLVAVWSPAGCGEPAASDTGSAVRPTVGHSEASTSTEPEAGDAPYLQTLEELGQMVLSGFSAGPSGPGVFGTHVDWHSSVHAHWALLRVAAETGDENLKDFVVGRLRPEDIAREQALLEEDGSFEMPYGRAWLLRLVVEYERATGDRLMRSFGDSVARSLDVYLSGRSDRAGLPEYGNLEWAAAALFDYGVATENGQLRESAETVGKALLAAGGTADWGVELRSDVGFFSVPGNRALLIAALASGGGGNEYVNGLAGTVDGAIDVPPARSSSHSIGLFFSRAWGLQAAYRMTGDEAFAAAYSRHVEAGLGELRRRNSDFDGVGHWVPQFAIFALSQGAPLTNSPGGL